MYEDQLKELLRTELESALEYAKQLPDAVDFDSSFTWQENLVKGIQWCLDQM